MVVTSVSILLLPLALHIQNLSTFSSRPTFSLFPLPVPTVFGKVLDGMDVVKYIEAVPKGPGDKPKEKITIQKSGEIKDHEVKEEL